MRLTDWLADCLANVDPQGIIGILKYAAATHEKVYRTFYQLSAVLSLKSRKQF